MPIRARWIRESDTDNGIRAWDLSGCLPERITPAVASALCLQAHCQVHRQQRAVLIDAEQVRAHLLIGGLDSVLQASSLVVLQPPGERIGCVPGSRPGDVQFFPEPRLDLRHRIQCGFRSGSL